MVTGRRMTISRPATLNRRNDFRAISTSRLRRGYSCSVIDGMHNSMNQNHTSTRRNAWHHPLRPDDIAQVSQTGDMRL
jgi:hypothetical protein